MRKTCILFMVLAMAAASITSCKSSKGAAVPSKQAVSVSRSAEAPSVAASLIASQYDWTDVQLPVSVTLRKPVSVSLNATAYMRRGEYIRFSVRMLGFEVASAWIDTDSVHAVDKMGKRYVSESVSRFTTALGLDIADVQDILLGRLFSISGNGSDAPDFTAETTEYDGLVLLRPASGAEILDYGFMVTDSETPQLAYLLVETDRFNAVAQYAGHDDTPAGTVARRVSLTSTAPKEVSAELTWNLGSAKWNRGENQKWQAPGKGYTKISLNSLLSILKKL
ncbi:MAG: DUF4292 domain-containing protein [Muribaculaceae bacterium]|nr:DUF4292 domain-containing protein [Muribaculaceae bacterium]